MPDGSSAHGFHFCSPGNFTVIFKLLWLSSSHVSNSVCPLEVATAALFPKLASLCLPSVSLTRPFVPSPVSLLLPAAAAA